MALPYGTVGCRAYKSKELLSDVLYALEWMYQNMYGENVITDTSFRSWKLYDWWDWYIGASCPMMNTLMIIEDAITPELITKYTTPIRFLRHKMKTAPEHYMSRIMPLTPLALLTCDRPLLKQLYEECLIMLKEHDGGNEMRRDYACMTHAQIYNIGYGFINLDRPARIIKILADTPLAYPIPVEKQYFHMNMVRYTFAPSMYKGRPFAPMNGRNMQKVRSVLNPLKYFYYAYGRFGDECDSEIKRIIRRNGTPHNRDLLISHFDGEMTLEEYRKINSGGARSRYEPVTKIVTHEMLYDALTNPEYDEEDYTLGYMWYSGDTAVQFRNDCMAGVRMCSKRAPSYECINGMNDDGWYVGEGALYLYTPNNETEYSPEWWMSADKHLIPGTTVQEREREPINIEEGFKNHQIFVGGVALDGQFLATTMDHEAFNNEIEGSSVDNGHGRGLPRHICTLTSKKSYFFFDKAILCMGCDVHSEDGYNVVTVIDNRLLAENEKVVVNGDEIPYSEGDVTREDIKYLYFEGGSAYFFPKGGSVTVRFYEKEGFKRVAVFLEHGVDPISEKYAYLIRLGVTREEAESYDVSDVEITRNDSEIQGARELHSGICAAAFRGAYEIYGIKADQPMIAMARKEGERIVSLAAADPTQLLDGFSFSLENGEDLNSTDVNITLNKAARLEVKVNCDSARGRAYYLN